VNRSYPRLLLYVFGVVVVASLLVAASMSGTAFGSYNPSWQGTSELRSMGNDRPASTEILQSTNAYDEVSPTETISFVIAPDAGYSTNDTDRLGDYVRAGGTLVVAGDFDTTANQLLRGLNSTARLRSVPVRDEQHYYQGPALPVATNVSAHPFTANVSQLTLNHPATLRLQGNQSTVLVETSSYAYLDSNGNEELDQNETLAHYPIVATEQIGDGTVVVASDPSVFINSMLSEPDNRALVAALLSEHDRMVLDVSHSGQLPVLIRVLTFLRESALVQLLAGSSLLVLFWQRERVFARAQALVRTSRSVSRDVPNNRQNVIKTSLKSRHPDWDEQRIERVAQTIMTRGTERGDDE
jgi:hypothetical protein